MSTDERFGVPVRYVLYSHHHWDHASGGAVFADTAIYIAHERMAAALAAPLPSAAAPSLRPGKTSSTGPAPHDSRGMAFCEAAGADRSRHRAQHPRPFFRPTPARSDFSPTPPPTIAVFGFKCIAT
ncbi:MBL fold metallo-hydrolase [Candidatus Rariloculus sp.]|uniref:MBL fold metallo-hydrolase n=1 Tax=Candidatus Rariloculus sp. TaxID=3101265 RepID=UPI003D13AEFE